MIEQLKIVVEKLGMRLYFGSRKQFNFRADEHLDGFLVFHEGYIRSKRSRDAQGALISNYSLLLWVYTASELPDDENDRLPRFAELSQKADELVKAMQSIGKIDAYEVSEVMNRTDRNLDGVLISTNVVVTSTTRC